MSSPLYLVDGYGLLYRAYYAQIKNPLRNSKGINTSVATGIVNYLAKFVPEHKPGHMVWVHEGGDSGRGAMFAGYKGTRKRLEGEQKDEFQLSKKHVADLLEGFGIRLLTSAGYEADDVIATLATQAKAQGVEVFIVSFDKDLYQLIDDGISILNPGRGGVHGVAEHRVTVENAHEKFGVPHTQVVDFLSLIGDSSDDIPGVKGIGDAGAVELLKQFGTLENILDNVDKIEKKRYRQALEQGREMAVLSKRLVIAQRDVPVTLVMDECRVRGADMQRLKVILEDLELRSAARRMGLDRVEVVEEHEELEVVDMTPEGMSMEMQEAERYYQQDKMGEEVEEAGVEKTANRAVVAEARCAEPASPIQATVKPIGAKWVQPDMFGGSAIELPVKKGRPR